jgi:hypothetical protein
MEPCLEAVPTRLPDDAVGSISLVGVHQVDSLWSQHRQNKATINIPPKLEIVSSIDQLGHSFCAFRLVHLPPGTIATRES